MTAPTPESHRFFTLAFCWADLLFEVDESRTIQFAAGATGPLLGRSAEELVGTPLLSLAPPGDRVLLEETLGMIARKGRAQGLRVILSGNGNALSRFELAGHVLRSGSCRCYLAARLLPHAAGTATEKVGPGELNSGSAFTALAAEKLREAREAGGNTAMTLVSLPGLADLEAKLSPDEKQRLQETVGVCLRAGSLDGDSAGCLGEGKYGLLHDKDLDVTRLEKQIAEASRAIDPEGRGLTVESGTLDADLGDIADEDMAKGLVYAINRFRESSGGFSFTGLKSNLKNLVNEAAKSLANFRSLVSDDKFEIAFHPILDVGTGHCHHYEALVRFNGNHEESPFKYITFAEETGLIPEFDIAMARKSVHWLAQRPNGKESLAVNISGNSVATPTYVEQLMEMLDDNRWLKGRLLFEITESARMADLETANGFIQKVREKGFPVCLDDFGAGAASFQYLSTLEVDVVKLDGSAVKNAEKAPKGTAFLIGLTSLCKSLNVHTVAEMVDTPETLEFVRRCGVEFAQGYLFGKPSVDMKTFQAADRKALFPTRRLAAVGF